MKFIETIFRSYDIRGVADIELSEELAYALGRAYVRLLTEKGYDLTTQSLVVGRDMRQSGDSYYPEVIRGITDEGVNVVAIGMSTTPLFNFTCAHYDEHAGGIMITASHNPAQYNGFKLALGNGLAVGKGSGMEALKQYVQEVDQQQPLAQTKGTVTETEFTAAYLDHIFSLVHIDNTKKYHIVVDAGNGMAKVTLPKVIDRLGYNAEYLYLEPDGTFPNHEANPLKTETLKDLQAKVKETNADFGFAIDADMDRIGLVDEQGNVVDPSYVGTLIGLSVLKKHPNATMLADLRSSMIVKEVWEHAGATVESCPVGHALIKPLMKEKRAAFASELSLHLYFKDMYNVESSDLCLLYIIQLLQEAQQPLSEIIAPLKKYAHSGEINFEVEDKDGVMESIENTYKERAQEISHLDGLKMVFDWGWVSIRKSNTEPVLRLNLESRDKQTTLQKVQEFSTIFS
ncbi:MAG: phosphomannomutase/phosphoglucomutase [Candidatus Magasanikbacteria bacterium]|uniref:Phosphomannomutase/phosphoglucomutase n=1 Tax=Candidatus Magasanikbacteria bacterium CG10_big_fil_rev_8_21_14_0_10_38_6 TaxID=1974647 RepID=A0A2M6P0I6_9BACT|nr:phosphomannomutase/phosphoglucomutase [Candidatus Magasanikbacteria bacterium]NCS71852.1 phosphomannomutase/phosphoglucomutase [Candidatus Magasanikbacteria bacterium]PIR77217.1 MAG: phosphomannomutase/phosphoglucomutase [Candidatus Magasanikbacteria bacterium CG10_big_fil_rev_8_21_14_0_10_38_6]